MVTWKYGRFKAFTFRFYMVTLLLSLMSSCGGSNGPVNLNPSLTQGDFPPGSVRNLVFDTSQEEILFPHLQGEEKFTLVLFPTHTEPGPWTIQFLDENQSTKNLTYLPEIYQNSLQPINEEKESDQTALAHETLRAEEAKLAGLEPYQPLSGLGVKELATTEHLCADGNGKLIKVLTSLSDITQYQTTCAIKMRTTEHAVYYVDDLIADRYNPTFFNSAIQQFEEKIPTERALLGQESDVNEDGRFTVYFTPSINRLGGNMGGFITGYFFGGDLFAQSEVASSNEEEIMYIVVPDPAGEYGQTVTEEFWQKNLGGTVLTHEYQHMISYHYKEILGKTGGELPWMNEGLSHLMEDLQASTESNLEDLSTNALSKVLDHASMENPSRVSVYLKDPAGNTFFAGSSLGQRGGAYLFFRYLYEQSNLGRYPHVTNGQELLTELVQNPLTGKESLERATGLSFAELLRDFYATLRLSNTGLNFSPRYNFTGISLTCAQEDGRGTRLEGIQPLALDPGRGEIQSDEGLFFELSGKQLMENGSKLKLGLDPLMEAAGVLIRTR